MASHSPSPTSPPELGGTEGGRRGGRGERASPTLSLKRNAPLRRCAASPWPSS